MKEFERWKSGRCKAACCIIGMVAFVAFMLLQSIYNKSTEMYVSRPLSTIDSLYIETHKSMDTINWKLSYNNIKSVERLKYKLDSIDYALRTLNRTILVLEKQTELRQDDIRQETNNIINKFNGNIEWWIFLLGIICGVAPILLTIITHHKDEEYMKILNSNYEKMKEQVKEGENSITEKEEKLNKLRQDLENAEKDRELDWQEKQKYLKLVFSFMYIASFTRKSKFQVAEDRELVVEKLMKEIVDSSLEFIEFEDSEIMKDRNINISFWILSAVEGVELLRPFISNAKIARQMDEVLKCLHILRNRYYNGEVFLHNDTDILAINKELNILKKNKWG